MSYQSDLGANPLIIDDGNASKLVDQWRQEGLTFGGMQRDYNSAPFGSASRPSKLFQYTFESDRGKLRDRIQRADENKTTPDDWRMSLKVPVLDQDSWGYCWFYGCCGAMLNCYAMTGGVVPNLNPFPTAYRIKNGRNEGGWGEEALRGIEQYGVVEESLWPGHEAKMSNWDRQEVKANAILHKVTESLELPRRDILALVSVLTDPRNPRPVTVGYDWWGHLIYAVRAGWKDGKFLVKIVNSWKETWGEKGTAWLTESKAIASEQIAIQRVSTLAHAA
jgi:C1A family cysteine protease